MKKIRITKKSGLLILLIPILFAFTKYNADGYTIFGTLTGNVEGKKVYVKYADIPSRQILDSTIIKNGKFTISGKAATPRFISLTIEQDSDPANPRMRQDKIITLFVENSSTPITIEANVDNLRRTFEIYGPTLTSEAAIIKGSPRHDEFMKFYGPKNKLDAERTALFNDYIAYLNPPKGEKKKPKEVGIDLALKMDAIEAKRKAYTLDYLKNKKPTELNAFIATQAINLASITTEEIDQLIRQFSTGNPKGILQDNFLTSAALTKKTAVGSDLANFVLTDLKDQPQSLSNYIGKGKYVLLEFWASWCGPCRADIPHLREAYDAYKVHGFDIVSISLDDKKENWLKAVKEEELESRWTQLCDLKAFEGEIAKTYRITGIPACLLFDPNGKLVTRNMRGSWMDAKLIELYGDHFKKGDAE